MESFVSTLNGQRYNIKDVARVPDRRLQMLYMKHGLRPVDMYISLDDNGRDIIVMLFGRSETADLYKLWIERKLK